VETHYKQLQSVHTDASLTFINVFKIWLVSNASRRGAFDFSGVGPRKQRHGSFPKWRTYSTYSAIPSNRNIYTDMIRDQTENPLKM
jgi:hypothetical protein